jgi:hypothetical protein
MIVTLPPTSIVAAVGLTTTLANIQDDPASPDANWLLTYAGTPWYVRPAGTTYGSANGTSYADAWAGFAAIQWASVQPGDTVYVAGRTQTRVIPSLL